MKRHKGHDSRKIENHMTKPLKDHQCIIDIGEREVPIKPQQNPKGVHEVEVKEGEAKAIMT